MGKFQMVSNAPQAYGIHSFMFKVLLILVFATRFLGLFVKITGDAVKDPSFRKALPEKRLLKFQPLYA